MPERQSGFLVNDLLFVAGSSAMARVMTHAARPLSCQDAAGSSGVGVQPRAPGARLGRRKGMRTKTLERARKALFVAFRPRLFMARAALGAVWRCGGAAVSVFAFL